MPGLDHCFPNLGRQLFWDYNSHHPYIAGPMVRDDGNCSPKTAGDPSLGNTDLAGQRFPNLVRQYIKVKVKVSMDH